MEQLEKNGDDVEQVFNLNSKENESPTHSVQHHPSLFVDGGESCSHSYVIISIIILTILHSKFIMMGLVIYFTIKLTRFERMWLAGAQRLQPRC